jgi:hypothetical protein
MGYGSFKSKCRSFGSAEKRFAQDDSVLERSGRLIPEVIEMTAIIK